MTPAGAERRTGARSRRLPERLTALFGAGVLALNSPLLGLFSRDLRLLGLPLLYVYLLLAWSALIIAIAVLMRPRRVGESRAGAQPPPDRGIGD